MDLNNKVAIITGSAQGLGKAFAARLLEVGVKVCISDLNKEKGEAALKELQERFGADKVCFVPCDVTKDEEFRNLFDKAEEYFKVGCVDILGNNAGINTNYGWSKCMEVNIMAVMNGTEIAMERMKQVGKHGQIINTASLGKIKLESLMTNINFISAGFGPGVNPEMTSYTVSKHGVVQMTRTMALANDGIMHKAICPSWTDTAILTAANDNIPEKDKTALRASIQEYGGLMTPEYVAEGFYRLLTQCGNGSTMVVLKDTPYIQMPDYNKTCVMTLALVSKLVDKVLSPEIVMGHHLVVALTLLFMIFCYLLTVIF